MFANTRFKKISLRKSTLRKGGGGYGKVLDKVAREGRKFIYLLFDWRSVWVESS